MQGCVIGETANKRCRLRIRTVGLPFELVKWIENHEYEVTLTNHLVSTFSQMNEFSTIENELTVANNFLNEFKQKLVDTQCSTRMIELIKRYLVCFGPKRCGPNILINQMIDDKSSMFSKFDSVKQHFSFEEEKKEINEIEIAETEDVKKEEEDTKLDDGAAKTQKKLNHHQKKRLRKLRKLDAVKQWFKVNEKEIQNSIIAGFEYATTHGPLFEEHILGACFIVDEIELIDPSSKLFLIKHKQEFEESYLKENDFAYTPKEKTDEEEKLNPDEDETTKEQIVSVGLYSDTYGPMTGQIMSLVSKLCRKGFLNAEPRIVEGMYKCELQVNSDNLGKIYSVLNRSRSKTLEEELLENSELFLLKILVPVYEGFKFSNEIRDRE